MPKTDLHVMELSQNALRRATGQGQTGTTTSNLDIATAVNSGTILAGDGNYVEIGEGDIAAFERIIVTINCTTAGSVTFEEGDYPPAIESARGDLTIALTAGLRSLVIDPSRFVRNDGTVRITGTAAFRGSLWARGMPRAQAGRAGTTPIPANPMPA